MAVRVRVRITDGGKSVVVKVLVNGGAESDEPLVVVDPDIASKLGISGEELDVIEDNSLPLYAHERTKPGYYVYNPASGPSTKRSTTA